MNKKEQELIILKQVYKKDKVEITESEKPDFIINGIKERFGVEITEYYYNESSARLKNKSGYFDKIIKSKDDSVLTKKDKGLITREAIYIKDTTDDKFKFVMDTVGLKYNDKYEFNVEPAYEDVEKQLIDRIEEKNEKAKEYKKLDYYELFIQDKENYFGKNSNRLEQLKNSKLLLDAIYKSNYKRLYIFSNNHLCIIGEKPNENMLKYGMVNEETLQILNKQGGASYE